MQDAPDSPEPKDEVPPLEVPVAYSGELPPVVVQPAELGWQPPPRLWSALGASVLAIGAGLVVSVGALSMAAAIDRGPEILQQRQRFTEWLTDFTTNPVGLLVVVVPGQLAFLVAAVAGGLLSPQPITERLRLVKGRYSMWSWLLFAVATPCVAMLANVLVNSLNREPSAQLDMLEKMFKSQSQHSIVLLLLMMSVLPGIAEELLFRGYLQSRLLQRFSPFWAIAISTGIFAAAHMDPQHAVGVIPLGAWLGIIAWRSGSVWPAMLCHAANNAFAILASIFAKFLEDPAAMGLFGMLVLTLCALALAASIAILAKQPRPATALAASADCSG